MDERVVQFRVGVMVVATVIIAAILALLFGELPARIQGQYTVYIHFDDASGVSRDTPIRLSGILIGRVRDVTFAEEEGVIVTASINNDVRLRHNQVCRVVGSLLGGDAELQFVRARDEQLPDTLIQDGELIAGVVAADPLTVIGNLEGELSVAIRSIGSTSDEVGRLAGQISTFVENNGEQFNRIVAKSEQTLDSLQRTIGDAESIIGDPELQADLRAALNDLPLAISEVREAINGMRNTVQLADRNLENLEGFTRPLGERGQEIISRFEQVTGRLDELANEFTQFGRALNNPNGSLGRLLNDPEMYENVNSAVTNIERLSRELRPVIRDARVFTDKIARQPSELGLGGILRQRSGIK